jgi:cystathionine beta-lyase/cystathionine gamma-synthase
VELERIEVEGARGSSGSHRAEHVAGSGVDDELRGPMKSAPDQGFGTKAIHAGQSPDPTTGAVSERRFCRDQHLRAGGPGRDEGLRLLAGRTIRRATALEQNLAGRRSRAGRFGLGFASGMAAIHCVLNLLRSRATTSSPATTSTAARTASCETLLQPEFGVERRPSST